MCGLGGFSDLDFQIFDSVCFMFYGWFDYQFLHSATDSLPLTRSAASGSLGLEVSKMRIRRFLRFVFLGF